MSGSEGGHATRWGSLPSLAWVSRTSVGVGERDKQCTGVGDAIGTAGADAQVPPAGATPGRLREGARAVSGGEGGQAGVGCARGTGDGAVRPPAAGAASAAEMEDW
eukprot:2857181-Pleurochrysis_carterae.AAC.1